METKPMRVLLYYKYVNIEDPETLTQHHLTYCKNLGIKGRILISSEGINGTCSGTWEQTEQYMNDLKANPYFSDIEFKIDEVEEHAFKKIFVRHKQELVTWRFDGEFDVPKQHGAYLEPAEWKEMMNRDDVVILDVRNNYEYDLGHFKNAIKIDVEASRDMPDWLEENKDLYEGKTLLTYCTGGVRCEKFTAYMRDKGHDNIFHLKGGVAMYGKDEATQGENWDGELYVFDERINVPVNSVNPSVVSTCMHCGTKTVRYVNCANPVCNAQHFCCEECEPKQMRSCSKECQEHPRNRFIIEKIAGTLQETEGVVG